ncbi:MAG: hypothetical protein MUE72_12160 [Chitinophagaceae bacterium]|nr:hypothetical protein [Chitinophagaceae bacterium]
MIEDIHYNKAIDLLLSVATPNGFIASAENTSNYQRVWARDGVICGLAALASGNQKLINTFENTLHTLATHQHERGTIPSNVKINETDIQVSYGGLAGRVDAVTWFIIGVCQFAYHQNKPEFVSQYESHINAGFALLEAWEFNNKHLVYVPLSGNWADEYITDGYVLYDQLLRLWALQSYFYFSKNEAVAVKIVKVKEQIETNFLPNAKLELFHERAYKIVNFNDFLPCSFSPSGYKSQFDAFANSLVLLLDIGSEKIQHAIINYATDLAFSTKLQLLPAFWPPIFDTDENWLLLKDNCKFEFRNYPYEFHNAGSWPMVNGFFGLALSQFSKKTEAYSILDAINKANAIADFSFYENFNTQNGTPNGVAYCAWSAAATILLHNSLNNNFKLFYKI